MTTLPEILDRIRDGVAPRDLESDQLEFKQEESADPRRSLEMLADAVVCLANAEGGTIVVGVADAVPGPAAFRGVSSRLTADVIRKGIFDRTRPSLSVPVSETSEGTARLVVITVPKGAVFYANAAGTATRRIGAECRPFPPEEQRQAMAARGLSDWSAEATDLGMESVSAEELARVRRLLMLAGREDLARSDERKLARDLRLLNTRGKLTRAGLLILGDAEAIAAALPNHGFAYQYRSSPGSESSARIRSARPFLAAVETLLDAVAVRSRVHPLSASGGVQIQIQDYPKDAVRELVVNALVHRDYELAGAVEVEHSPDSLAITSPGGLVFGITPENILTHPSTPRNRLLLETVTALQVAERTGQGIDRAYRELLRTGKVPPTFSDDGYQVRVLVPGGTGNDAFARFVADLDPELGGDVDVLLAISLLRDSRNIDAARLAAIAQRSTSEAQGVLERLVHAKVMEPTARTASRALPTYVLTGLTLAGLGRAVRYHVRRADETDRKVADHIREYGHVTNQTLRRLFDLDVTGARDLLRALQQRGVLVKLDQGRGGPGIRYGRGPKMQTSDTRPSRADRQPASGPFQSCRAAGLRQGPFELGLTEFEPNPAVPPPIVMEATPEVMMSDEQTPAGLIEAARAGDRAAFGQLVEPFLAPSLGGAVVMTRSHADGADAVQDALLAAWQGIGTLRDPAAFPAWFRTLVVRSALRIARRRGALVSLEVAETEGLEDGGLDASVDRRLLGRAFDSLHADDRALLTLRYLWGLTVAETAAALDTQPGTVKSRTHAAIGRLRAAFDSEARR